MRDGLTCWDSLRQRGFTGQEAALAMVGEPQTDDPEKLLKASPALELMRASYEGTRRWFADAPEDAAAAPRGLLVSVEMQANAGRTSAELDAIGAGEWRFLIWLRTPMADFDRQTFTREVLARWVQEVEASSLYPFTAKADQAAIANVQTPQIMEQLSSASSWAVVKPERFRGYMPALHRFLLAAHRNGNARPTAREVIEEWRSHTPPEIAKVLTDGIDYYDSTGNTQFADLEAIKKTIYRLTTGR